MDGHPPLDAAAAQLFWYQQAAAACNTQWDDGDFIINSFDETAGHSDDDAGSCSSPETTTASTTHSEQQQQSQYQPASASADVVAAAATDKKPPRKRKKRQRDYRNCSPETLSRRRSQNRQAQRNYRERKTARIQELEDRVAEELSRYDSLLVAYSELRGMRHLQQQQMESIAVPLITSGGSGSATPTPTFSPCHQGSEHLQQQFFSSASAEYDLAVAGSSGWVTSLGVVGGFHAGGADEVGFLPCV